MTLIVDSDLNVAASAVIQHSRYSSYESGLSGWRCADTAHKVRQHFIAWFLIGH